MLCHCPERSITKNAASFLPTALLRRSISPLRHSRWCAGLSATSVLLSLFGGLAALAGVLGDMLDCRHAPSSKDSSTIQAVGRRITRSCRVWQHKPTQLAFLRRPGGSIALAASWDSLGGLGGRAMPARKGRRVPTIKPAQQRVMHCLASSTTGLKYRNTIGGCR